MLLLGAVVLVVLVMSVVAFPSSRFLVSGGWGCGVGGSPPVVLFLSLLFLASCVSSVSTKSDNFYVCRNSSEDCGVRKCVRIILLTVFCKRRLLASFARAYCN